MKKKNSSQQGITMIEMIASMLISSLLVAFAFNGFSYYRQSFINDQDRNSLNQSLGGVSNLVAPDIVQIGENLTDDPFLPTMEVRQPTVDSSEIVIRKSPITNSLPLCADLKKGENSPLVVFDKTITDPLDPNYRQQCQLLDDFTILNLDKTGVSPNDPNGYPDILERWIERRKKDETKGVTARAYIYDGTGNGEFFDYTLEVTQDQSGVAVTPTLANPTKKALLTLPSDHKWQYDYSASGSSRIYLIEEKAYGLNLLRSPDDEKKQTLQVIVNPVRDSNGNIDSNKKYNQDSVFDLAVDIANFNVVANVSETDNATNSFDCTVIPPVKGTDCKPDEKSDQSSTYNFAKYSWKQISYLQVKTTLSDDILRKNHKFSKFGEKEKQDFREKNLIFTEQFFPRNKLSL